MEAIDATEEVAGGWEKVSLPYEEVAKKESREKPNWIVVWPIGGGRVEPEVAEPAMEVDQRYTRVTIDLVPRDQDESIQVPLISQPSLGNVVVREDSGSPEGKYKNEERYLGRRTVLDK